MKRVVIAAVLAGVIGGSIAALVVPDSGRSTAPAPRVAQQREATRPDAPKVRLVPGSMRIELRAGDPDGGVPWAIRSYVAVVVGHSTRMHCSQLGRVLHGRFGWIDGSNVFRPAGLESFGQAPAVCGDAEPGVHQPPRFDARTLVRGIDGPRPSLGTAVVWGMAGRGAERVEVRLSGRSETPRLEGRGAFLVFGRKAPHRDEATATFTYRGGETRRAPERQHPFPPNGPAINRNGSPRAGAVELLARAPDPAGGLPYGFGGVRSDRDGFCVGQPQRVVGDRVGNVDFDLGTFAESFFPVTECSLPNDPRLEKHPVGAYYMFSDGGIAAEDEGEGAAAHRARVERRTLPGTSIVAGTARADVRSLTIATPRDVRTIVPSSPAHGYIAVYDGGFPTGKIVTTAHFADGTSKVVDSFDVGGL